MSSPPPVPPKDIPPRRSSLTRSVSHESATKQSGYSRPFPPPSFSSSAMHRNSVLALGITLVNSTLTKGKIEHLQHYFAVSGKLDRKGAGYAPTKSNTKVDSTYGSLHGSPEAMEQEIPLPPERDSTSPTPTAPKPESLKQTRRELLSALTECEQSLIQGQGMDIVESATATIRLAQKYRTQVQHEDWEDEKKLRRHAVDVLVILRNMAERDGNSVTVEENNVVKTWCKDVRTRIERDDEVRRGTWARATAWMEGNWEGKEWERYHLFLTQFDPSEPKLPSPSSKAFLDTLRTGTKLCLIHNTLTHFSLRPFGLITRFHQDTTVQYRVTDNLRYFAKAAEIRWDIDIDWDVEEIWRATPRGDDMLQRQLGIWCAGVIAEIVNIYREECMEGEAMLDELMGELGK